ncbi:hypothetical protein [Streptomyces collinus]
MQHPVVGRLELVYRAVELPMSDSMCTT